MKSSSMCFGAVMATILLVSPTLAADMVSTGKVKSINAGNKDFILTDGAGKDWTIKFGDKVVINRGGKESKTDLNAGDSIQVCYDKGVLTWTAHYILVREGDTKDFELIHGTVKSYDATKKQLDFTDDTGKDVNFVMGSAKVRLNDKDSKIEEVKIGDHFLALVEKVGDKSTLKCIMVEHK